MELTGIPTGLHTCGTKQTYVNCSAFVQKKCSTNPTLSPPLTGPPKLGHPNRCRPNHLEHGECAGGDFRLQGGRSVGVCSGRALCTRMTLERVSMHVFQLSLTARMEEGNNSSQIMDWRYRFVDEYVQHSFNHRMHLGIHACASGSTSQSG